MVIHNNVIYKIAMVAAVADNNVIGKDNNMPWRQPADLNRFRNLTLGHVIIMGKSTQVSIGLPLDKRVNIVLSHKPYYADGFITMQSLHDAIQYAIKEDYRIISQYGEEYTEREIFIIGGQSVYEQALCMSDVLYITNIYSEMDGDRFFPELDATQWTMTGKLDYDADEINEHAYSFVKYCRISYC